MYANLKQVVNLVLRLNVDLNMYDNVDFIWPHPGAPRHVVLG
jgi:hypothetical protein